MPQMKTLIHASSNGDRWFLCRGDDAADVVVVHEPNRPSGGTPSRIAVAAFLATGSGSPEHRALLAMIGSLVEPRDAGSESPLQGPEPGAAGAEPTPGEAADRP